jgi:hypothetical protein
LTYKYKYIQAFARSYTFRKVAEIFSSWTFFNFLTLFSTRGIENILAEIKLESTGGGADEGL